MRRSAEAVYRASRLKKRHVGSCEACRASKTRCDKSRPTCRRYLPCNIDCTYSVRSATKETEYASQPSEGAPSVPLPPKKSMLDYEALRSRLLNAYLERVSPLRCLSFVHKPSFMYALDQGKLMDQYHEPLVDAMCALGAKHLSSTSLQEPSNNLANVGQAFSEKAHVKVMAQLHVPTGQQLMTTILLCEYAARTNWYAMAFVLVGCIFRQLCLLDLDAPCDGTGFALLQLNVTSRIASYGHAIVSILASLLVSTRSLSGGNEHHAFRYPARTPTFFSSHLPRHVLYTR